MKIINAVISEAFNWGKTIRLYKVKIDAPSTFAAAI